MTRQATALDLIKVSESDWRRMGWNARQGWLRAADRARRALGVDLAARTVVERANRVIVAAITEEAKEIRATIPDDPDGPAHLAVLDEETRQWELSRRVRAA